MYQTPRCGTSCWVVVSLLLVSCFFAYSFSITITEPPPAIAAAWIVFMSKSSAGPTSKALPNASMTVHTTFQVVL